MPELVYCATPSRVSTNINEIMDFVAAEGNAPLHPFQAFPYERFEGNPKIGRKKSMEWCFRLISISDRFYMFGVSKGTLEEIEYAIKIAKPITLHLDFDPEWQKYYKQLGHKYDNLLDDILT